MAAQSRGSATRCTATPSTRRAATRPGGSTTCWLSCTPSSTCTARPELTRAAFTSSSPATTSPNASGGVTRSSPTTCISAMRRPVTPGLTAARRSTWPSPWPTATATSSPPTPLFGVESDCNLWRWESDWRHWLPVGAERNAGPAGGAQLDPENLVQLDLVAVEPQPRPGHIEPPDPGGSLTDLGNGLLPVLVKVGAPGGKGERVVLPQVLRVPDLEAGIVQVGDQVSGAFQLAVGEDVPVDEPIGDPRGAAVVRPGDAVIQQPAARIELAVKETEVAGKLRLADVLGEPDRTDRVEAGLGDLAVVQMPHLGEVLKARLLDRPLGPQGLLLRQRDAKRSHAVVACRVHDHAAPAAAHVEQPHPGRQPDLPGHQVELVFLRLLH